MIQFHVQVFEISEKLVMILAAQYNPVDSPQNLKVKVFLQYVFVCHKLYRCYPDCGDSSDSD